MKNKIVLLFCITAMLTAVLLVMLHDFILKRNVTVHAVIDDVALLFTDLEKWKYWHPDFTGKDTNAIHKTGHGEQSIALPGLTYRIRSLHPAATQITRIEQGSITNASLSAMPYNDGSYTYVEYTQAVSGFRWLKQKFSGHDKAMQFLLGLQAFAEDDSRRYGFSIHIVPVSDTLILTTRIKVPKDSVLNSIPVLYNRLRMYCRQQTIPAVKDYYYVSTTFSADNQAELAVGIPVQQETATQQPGFEFLRLPVNGKLVNGSFKGRYTGLQQLYAAMNKYMLDKRLKKVAQPLEQYHNSDTSFTAGSMVSVRVFYPVF